MINWKFIVDVVVVVIVVVMVVNTPSHWNENRDFDCWSMRAPKIIVESKYRYPYTQFELNRSRFVPNKCNGVLFVKFFSLPFVASFFYLFRLFGVNRCTSLCLCTNCLSEWMRSMMATAARRTFNGGRASFMNWSFFALFCPLQWNRKGSTGHPMTKDHFSDLSISQNLFPSLFVFIAWLAIIISISSTVCFGSDD